jgi:superfamily II DNA or RNA helicase
MRDLFITSKGNSGRSSATVIVVPNTGVARSTWVKEFERFEGEGARCFLRCDYANWQAFAKEASDVNIKRNKIMIVTYEQFIIVLNQATDTKSAMYNKFKEEKKLDSLKTLYDLFTGCNFLVFDECQRIQNSGTKRTQTIMSKLKGVDFILGLTGTPVTNWLQGCKLGSFPSPIFQM